MSFDNPIDFKIGQTYRASLGHARYNIHIVSVVDDGHGKYVVYRHYSKRKQRWIYEIESIEMLDMYVGKAKEWDEFFDTNKI